MKKLLALALLLAMLASVFCSCGSGLTPKEPDDVNPNKPPSQVVNPTVITPDFKDYGRGTVNFDLLVYERPSISEAISAFNEVTKTVRDNTLPVEEQINAIKALEDGFNKVEGAFAMTQIYSAKDRSESFWQEEYKYFSTNYPSFNRAIEGLLVACAASPHRATLENEYFGYSLNEYTGGGIYTDALVELLAEEARIEAEYVSLSGATVEITYSSVMGTSYSGTANEVYAKIAEEYKNDPEGLKKVYTVLDMIYEQALLNRQKPLYVELVKVRRLIADELGYDSYVEFAYDNMGYDYEPSDAQALLGRIAKYVTPVARELEYTVFKTYFQNRQQPTMSIECIINTLYLAYFKMDSDLFDAYCYMLQHGLYDAAPPVRDRYEGAFTTYIPSNNSPFLFVNTSGFIKDFVTLSHEFGHFADGFINYGADASLALAEVSSQGLELLTVLELKSELGDADYEYLEYYSIYTAINSVLLTQSFYAQFEHMTYALAYEEITKDKLDSLVTNAAKSIYGDDISFNGNLSHVLMTHTVLYPLYVESYVISELIALDIFFMESYRTGNDGAGLAVYKELINRRGNGISLEYNLDRAGLTSPFESGKIKEIANNAYSQITGKSYYKDGMDDLGAA